MVHRIQKYFDLRGCSVPLLASQLTAAVHSFVSKTQRDGQKNKWKRRVHLDVPERMTDPWFYGRNKWDLYLLCSFLRWQISTTSVWVYYTNLRRNWKVYRKNNDLTLADNTTGKIWGKLFTYHCTVKPALCNHPPVASHMFGNDKNVVQNRIQDLSWKSAHGWQGFLGRWGSL